MRKHVERNETWSSSSSSSFSSCYYFLSNRANNFALSHWISVIGWFAYKRSCLDPTCVFFSKSQQMSMCLWEYPDTTHQQSIIVNVLNQSSPLIIMCSASPICFVSLSLPPFDPVVAWSLMTISFEFLLLVHFLPLILRCLLLYSLAQCWKMWSIMRDSSPSPTTCFLTYTTPIGRKKSLHFSCPFISLLILLIFFFDYKREKNTRAQFRQREYEDH